MEGRTIRINACTNCEGHCKGLPKVRVHRLNGALVNVIHTEATSEPELHVYRVTIHPNKLKNWDVDSV